MQDQSETFRTTVNDFSQHRTGLPDALPLITEVLDNAGAQQGALFDGDITDARQPVISGKGIPNSHILVTITDGRGQFIQVDENGDWSYTPDIPLADGTHVINVRQWGTDTESSFVINVNREGPVRPVIAGAFDDVGDATGLLPSGSYTDDRRPTFTGSGATPNGELRIRIGIHHFSLEADSDGNWSWTPPYDINVGTYFVVIEDVGNGTSNEIFTISIYDGPTIELGFDNVGMSQGSLFNGATTDDMRPTLQGKALPNAEVSIYDNGVLAGIVTADEYGAWFWEGNTDLSAGTHNFQARAGDQTSNNFVLSLEPSPAAPAILSAFDDVGGEQGVLANGSMTDDARPQLAGTGEPGTYIAIYDNGRLISNVLVGTDGRWTYTPEGLADGVHSLIAATAQGSSEPFVLIIQGGGHSDKPVINTVFDNAGPVQGELANGATTDDTTPTFSGMAKPGSMVRIQDGWRFLGEVQADENGHWTFTPREGELTAGEHAINVSNVYGESSFQLVIAPPVASIVSAYDDVGSSQGELISGALTDDSRPTLNGTGVSNSYVNLYDNGRFLAQVSTDANGRWTYTPEGLGDGQHTFTVANPYGTSEPFVLNIQGGGYHDKPVISSVLDNAGPVQGELANGATTDDTTPTFSGMAKPGSMVRIQDGWRFLGEVQADENGHWTFTPREGELVAGEHTFHVSNSFGESSLQLVIEGSAPSITVAFDNAGNEKDPVFDGGTTDDTAPTLIGISTVGGITLTIYDNDVEVGQVWVPRDSGFWTWGPYSKLPAGEHVFTVAGPDGVHSDPFHMTILPPAPEVLSIYDDVGSQQGEFADGSAGTVTDDARPQFSGAGQPGSTIYIYDGYNNGALGGSGTLLGSVTVKENGTWSFTPDHDLSDGIHLVSSSYTDDGRNQGHPIAILIDTSDNAAPQSDTPSHEPSTGNIGALSVGDLLADEGDALFGANHGDSAVITDIAAQTANTGTDLGDVMSHDGALAAIHTTTSSELLNQWEVAHPTVH